MALVPVDLPTPDALRGRWAAFAAICAARGWARSCHADGPRWHFDDGGGNWADLVHVGDGRAVLLGHDHEYSDTYYAEAAAYFGELETDLRARAPEWWAPPVRAALRRARGRGPGRVHGSAAHGGRAGVGRRCGGGGRAALPRLIGASVTPRLR